ncbi:MAG: hypothetical protein OEQ47_05850 [Acidimicrobiia bacterium]|nr:hypothetical protein [Acidimicrobiia bacterium]
MRTWTRIWTVTAYGMVFLLMSAIPGVAEGDVCVAVDGDVKVDSHAGSECAPSNDGIAVAVNGSVAYVRDGVDNLAVAVNGSSATAWLGDDGRAIAVNQSWAGVSGDSPFSVTGNSAVAVNESGAFAGAGSDNTAFAANSSLVFADGGNDNTATAINDSEAYASVGDGHTALAINSPTHVANAVGDTLTVCTINDSTPEAGTEWCP